MSNHVAKTEVRVETRPNGSTEVSIESRDPLIVRADILVINRDERSLRAVVDGFLADLGELSDDLIQQFDGRSHAFVQARHFAGGHVRRSVPIVRH